MNRAMTIRKILAPTDFSPGADVALERALDLRQRFGASLTLFHAFELPVVYADGYGLAVDFTAAVEQAAREAMQRTRTRAEARARALDPGGGDLRLSAKVVPGAPLVAILDEASEGGYDLIVMGTHGRTGLAHAFIGSVAERVVRAAPCAVLTERTPRRGS